VLLFFKCIENAWQTKPNLVIVEGMNSSKFILNSSSAFDAALSTLLLGLLLPLLAN
jgi:hypothetical protein